MTEREVWEMVKERALKYYEEIFAEKSLEESVVDLSTNKTKNTNELKDSEKQDNL